MADFVVCGQCCCKTFDLDTWRCTPCRDRASTLTRAVEWSRGREPDLDRAGLKAILDVPGGTRVSRDEALARRAYRRAIFKALPKAVAGYYLPGGFLLIRWLGASRGAIRVRLD